MKKAKIKKIDKIEKEEVLKSEYSLKKLLLIILVVCVVLGIFYFITVLVVKPNNIIKTDNLITEINAEKITFNQLFTRPEEKYYVLAVKKSLHENNYSKENYIDLYNKYIEDYKSRENSLKFYIIDLDDAFNKNYISEELSITDNVDNLKLNDEVLFKINNKTIESYYAGKDSIINELSNLKKS
ncbi:MAG: hypothetical protein Q4E75_06460 [bacterium]|nr:hypothetical protein [bacterium]